jgi:hypothetical protein
VRPFPVPRFANRIRDISLGYVSDQTALVSHFRSGRSFHYRKCQVVNYWSLKSANDHRVPSARRVASRSRRDKFLPTTHTLLLHPLPVASLNITFLSSPTCVLFSRLPPALRSYPAVSLSIEYLRWRHVPPMDCGYGLCAASSSPVQ